MAFRMMAEAREEGPGKEVDLGIVRYVTAASWSPADRKPFRTSGDVLGGEPCLRTEISDAPGLQSIAAIDGPASRTVYFFYESSMETVSLRASHHVGPYGTSVA